MPGEFGLSTAGLARAAAVAVDRDFEFVIGGKIFTMNRFSADFLSPAVARLHGTDPLCTRFEVDVKDDPDKFELFVRLANGETIDITSENAYFLSRVAEQLENVEIVTEVFNITAERALDIENVIHWLNEKTKFGIDPIVEVTFIAQNFWTMPLPSLCELSYENLVDVISSPFLMIEDENQLLDVIIHVSNEKGTDYRRLLSLLHFEFLDTVGMKKFLDFVSIEDVNVTLWEAVSLRLSMGITYLENVEAENTSAFPRVRIGCVPREDNAIFFESARNIWNDVFPGYGSGVVPRDTFLSTLAEILRFETQPLNNAVDVLGSIFPVDTHGVLCFTDLCRLLAMFGPASSIMTKISQLFSQSLATRWLVFGTSTDGEGKYGCFNSREMNCLELHNEDGTVRRVWNLPQVDADEGEILIDENEKMYESWNDYFEQCPF